MQKLLAENEKRMLRLLADSSKSSQTDIEERLLRLLAENGKVDVMQKLFVETEAKINRFFLTYLFAGLFILVCILVGIVLIFFLGLRIKPLRRNFKSLKRGKAFI